MALGARPVKVGVEPPGNVECRARALDAEGCGRGRESPTARRVLFPLHSDRTRHALKHLRSSVPALGALVLLASCRREQPKIEPARTDVGDAAVAPAPLATPSAAATHGAKVREGTPGSTKGTIACGGRRCKAADEVCVRVKGLWTCVEAGKDRDAEQSFACDDRTDCTALPDQTCCEIWAGHRSCGYREATDSEPCGLEVCNSDVDAPPCPTGQSCVAGVCRPPAQRATCAGGKRCPTDKPACKWEKGRGDCITTAEADELEAKQKAGDDPGSAFACTKSSDCGAGHVCCTEGMAGAEDVRVGKCRFGCGAGWQPVCEKNDDCPTFFATGLNGGPLKQRCVRRPPAASHPAWLGACTTM